MVMEGTRAAKTRNQFFGEKTYSRTPETAGFIESDGVTGILERSAQARTAQGGGDGGCGEKEQKTQEGEGAEGPENRGRREEVERGSWLEMQVGRCCWSIR